jgi:hypothetical protein
MERLAEQNPEHVAAIGGDESSRGCDRVVLAEVTLTKPWREQWSIQFAVGNTSFARESRTVSAEFIAECSKWRPKNLSEH